MKDTIPTLIGLGLSVVTFCGLVVGIFVLLRRTYFRDWRAYDAVESPRQAAYRGGPAVAGYTEQVLGPPRIVQAVAFISILYGALGLLSAPLAALGVVVDLIAWKEMTPGFGLWFGPTGVALAICSLVFGIRVMKREASVRRFGNFLVAWTVLHNLALVAFGGFVMFTIDPRKEIYSLSGVQKAVVEGYGIAMVAPFVCLALLYALLVFLAVRRHAVRDAQMAETVPQELAHPSL